MVKACSQVGLVSKLYLTHTTGNQEMLSYLTHTTESQEMLRFYIPLTFEKIVF